MKIIAISAFALAVAWTGFVVFANGMRTSDTGDFIGTSTLVVVWLIVAVLNAIAWI